MERVRSLIERAAPTDANVLILGENGTGKEIVAREIHRLSRRGDQPMVSVDLGATTETLFESELFGHVKGAFTGAAGERIGRIKAADHSTLFLDEIGNLPLHLQPKLLTALEQRQVVPGRRQQAGAIDVRVVAATNLAPDQLADESASARICCSASTRSRSSLPPLRERREDIPLLLDHYLALYARKYDRPAAGAAPGGARGADAARLARQRPRAAPRRRTRGDHGRRRALSTEDFSLPAALARPPRCPRSATRLNLDQLEKQMIERALRMHHFNISLAAARARPQPRGALPADGEAWALGASSNSGSPGARSCSSAPSLAVRLGAHRRRASRRPDRRRHRSRWSRSRACGISSAGRISWSRASSNRCASRIIPSAFPTPAAAGSTFSARRSITR